MIQTTGTKRLLSLDVFRGITVAGMIIVNSPGGDDCFPWVAHAPWHGWTPADLVFPAFLVIMGCSRAISLSRRGEGGDELAPVLWQIVRRSLIIFALGLLTSII